MNALVNFGKIFKFNGGVHPPENKTQSTQLPIAKLSIPNTLVLPLRQHVGNIPKVKVSVGDHVLKGQLLAEAEGMVSAAIHAPTSGTITAIADAIIPAPVRPTRPLHYIATRWLGHLDSSRRHRLA